MIKYITMTSRVQDVLRDRATLDDDFELVKYDPYEHKLVVPQIYSRTLDKKPLSELWDQVEGFYQEGVYLILHRVEAYFIGFAISHIENGIPYIAAIGVMEKFRHRGLGTFLVQKLAEHYAKMGYKEIWIDLKPHNDSLETRFERLGFTKMEKES